MRGFTHWFLSESCLRILSLIFPKSPFFFSGDGAGLVSLAELEGGGLEPVLSLGWLTAVFSGGLAGPTGAVAVLGGLTDAEPSEGGPCAFPPEDPALSVRLGFCSSSGWPPKVSDWTVGAGDAPGIGEAKG
jgi:hypothetical protein